MTFSPALLFTYNRPKHTEQTISHLVQNFDAPQTDLFVYSDGPRMKSDRQQVNEVRKLITTVTGFKSITTISREDNFGLARSIVSGVTEILRTFDSVIVLEDDIVVSRYFLSYMNHALDHFREDERIASIHGWNFPLKADKLPDSFFLRGADCWGWATWKRAWDLFESDGGKLLNEIERQNLSHEFDLDGAYPYTQMLRDQISGKNNSWAIRWHASMYLKNMLTLHPRASLVVNIGLDGSGVHSQADASLRTSLPLAPPQSFPQEITEDREARRAIINYLEKSRKISRMRSLLTSLKRRLVAVFSGQP